MRSLRWELAPWVALALFLGRLSALFVADVLVREEPSAVALLRLLGRAPTTLGVALAGGLACSLACVVLARVPALLVVTLVAFVALAGQG